MERSRLHFSEKIFISVCILVLLATVVSIVVFSCFVQPQGTLVIVEVNRAYKIVYDVDTGVMYYVSNVKYSHAGLFPLYEADGSLKLYQKEKGDVSYGNLR